MGTFKQNISTRAGFWFGAGRALGWLAGDRCWAACRYCASHRGWATAHGLLAAPLGPLAMRRAWAVRWSGARLGHRPLAAGFSIGLAGLVRLGLMQPGSVSIFLLFLLFV